MPRELTNKSSLGALGKILVQHKVPIAYFQRRCGLSYRTVWLATHGYRVSYSSAVTIIDVLKKMLESGEMAEKKRRNSKIKQPGVTIDLLCNAQPRSEFVSTAE
jgi:hypothetical protein